ncbi:MAG: hypothetical protein C4334_07065 [Pyrinomonas sp.]|mgnify:CR=1 FL=1|uniref:DUF5658 family protein n=1 Tax=Pyrinomonas sp. TaxID=2080306 RepID=UPI003317503A
MNAPAKCTLLFLLNLLDAKLTLLWVRAGMTEEGNWLMARLLEAGDAPFLAVKVLVGAFAAYVLWRWSDRRLARGGLDFALALYLGLMLIHAVTAAVVFDGRLSAATAVQFFK